MENGRFSVQVCIGEIPGSAMKVSGCISYKHQIPVPERILFGLSEGPHSENHVPEPHIVGIEHLTLSAHALGSGRSMRIYRNTAAGKADHQLV